MIFQQLREVGTFPLCQYKMQIRPIKGCYVTKQNTL